MATECSLTRSLASVFRHCRFAGPKRWYAPPVALDDLPEIDAVVISHDHYDHLDMHTIQRDAFVAATCLSYRSAWGAHLAYWGIPESRIS
jgi:L-ascorbate metabolism protein UlaG (beta-lactamase superfamily)